jgi:hypothetical protein
MAYGMESRQDGPVRKKPKKDTDLSSSFNRTVRPGLGRDGALRRGDRSPAAMFGVERVPHPALTTTPSMPAFERAELSAIRQIRTTGR